MVFSEPFFFNTMENHHLTTDVCNSIGTSFHNSRSSISSMKLTSMQNALESIPKTLEFQGSIPRSMTATKNLQSLGIVSGTSFTKTKGACTVEQPPITHNFGVLRCSDEESHMQQGFSRKMSISVTNNLPVKGLKHIPILQAPVEGSKVNFHASATQASCMSLGFDESNMHGHKRKIDSAYNRDLQDASIKKPNFANGLFEPSVTGMRVQDNQALYKSGSLPSEVVAFDLNSRNVLGAPLNASYVLSKPYAQINSEQDQTLTLQALSGQSCPNSVFTVSTPGMSVESDNTKKSSFELNFHANSSNNQTYSKSSCTPKVQSSSSDWGKFLALSASSETSSQVEKKSPENYDLRLKRLQEFLKQCDDTGYSQCLWPLSAPARSALAVKLEERAIMLSLEEVKEFSRLNTLGVFGKNLSSSTKDVGAGAILKLLVPNPS